MKNNFSVSFANSYKRYGLPLIFIQVTDSEGLGFEFLIDTSSKQNWIDPDFIQFFTVNNDTLTHIISTDELMDLQTNPFDGVYKKLGSHKIICRDGKKIVVEKVRFNFSFECKIYSDIFSINSILEVFHNNKNAQVVAILGGEFLRKNKWVIDYNKLLIYSANFK